LNGFDDELSASASDDQLLDLYRQGDAAAFEVLFERHHAPVYHYARAMLVDAAASEDVLQDAFLAVARAARQYQPQGQFRPWLMRIAAMPQATFHTAGGCPTCNGTGYRGRTAIFEILVMDDRLREAIAASADLPTLRETAITSGMKPMLLDGLEKAARGLTSIPELLRVVPIGSGE
jgi:hypothetical protein